MWAIRRSIGHGLGLLLTIGSVYGIARSWIFDGFTHFLFDASVLGAYLGVAPRLLRPGAESGKAIRSWVIALSLLPLILILCSPFLDAQPIEVQLLGLRPAVLFLPLLLLGAMVSREDWSALAMWGAFTAIGAAVVMLGEYLWGVETFFPMNDASKIIYLSQDVGHSGEFRLPATFSSAHAYGGTMVAIVPLLLLLVESSGWRRLLAVMGLLAAVLGIFGCGARSPVLALGLVGVVVALRALRRPALRLAVLATALVAGVVVSREERFQRFETLSDEEYVETRVAGSVNMGLLDIFGEYPLGRGLGSAVGTSIPYFLMAEAKPQVGMESEYARIMIEQGVLGLVLWMSFAIWTLSRAPFRSQRLGGVADVGIWAFCAFSWGQGFIGTGFLASIPLTMVLLLYMGFLGSAMASESSPGVAPFVDPGRFVARQST
jgi:hypothetical protein